MAERRHLLGNNGFYESGYSRVGALSPRVDNQKRSDVAGLWNTPDHLREFVIRTSKGSINIGSTRIHLTVSDTPYSDNHIMLLVENESMLKRAKPFEAEIIHEQPDEIQLAYWLTAIKSLDKLNAHAAEGDLIVFSENTCCMVTNGEVRLPRTIGLIHGHAVRFSNDKFSGQYYPEADDPLTLEEIDFWNRRGDAFVGILNRDLPDTINFSSQDSVLPPGYSAFIPRAQEDLITASTITYVVKTHHFAYRNNIMDFLGDEGFKPQPSYRTYIYPGKDGVLLHYSPITHSFHGSYNAAGISLQRTYDPNLEHEGRRDDILPVIKDIEQGVKFDLGLL